MADPNTAFFSLLLLLPLSLLLLLLYLIVRPRPIKIPIKKRHVFITGGSSGIGLALAHRFASEGARVSILARDQAKLDAAKQAISLSTGVDVAAFSADVRDFSAVKKAVEAAAAAAEGGPIDILVCNQGVFTPQELEYQPLEEIKNMIDINLMGNFNLIKAALPLMKIDRQTRGPASIAIMSSQAGQVGIYGYTAYAASKFGLRGLAEALQQEVIADNIHVSLIFPPDTETPGLEEDSKYFLKMRSKLPLVPPSSLRAGTPSGKGTQRSYYPSEHPPKNELHAHFPLYTSRKKRGDLSDKLPGTSMSAQRANMVSHPFRWRPYLLLSHDAIERRSLMGTSKATSPPGKYFGNQSANAQTSLYLRPISLSISPLPLLL